MSQNEAPDVPLYATAYLNLNEVDESVAKPGGPTDPTQAKTLRTCFTQPGVLPDFSDKVRQRKVAHSNIGPQPVSVYFAV